MTFDVDVYIFTSCHATSEQTAGIVHYHGALDGALGNNTLKNDIDALNQESRCIVPPVSLLASLPPSSPLVCRGWTSFRFLVPSEQRPSITPTTGHH